jgi:hypothetical protein
LALLVIKIRLRGGGLDAAQTAQNGSIMKAVMA